MCSELRRDTERLTETISSVECSRNARVCQQVTDCNTRFIHWRPHADRDMVPLDPKRFSVNQDAMVALMGWAGNMTLSCAFLQGVLFA